MKKTSAIIMLVTLAAAATSCSVLNPSKKSGASTTSGAQATKIESTARPETTTENKKPVSQAAEAANPEAVKQSVPAPAVSKITMNTGVARRLGGEWTIVQVGATTIDRDEDMPYIIFEPSTAQFYANNGCNTLNGTYAVDTDDNVTFHNILSTLRMCPDVEFENQINSIITENVPVKVRLSEVGQESFVEFIGTQGKPLMRMRRGNLEFLNGHWNVESVAGLGKLAAPADIFFDLGELKLNGDTGCNIVNGNIYLDHRQSNAVDFSNMGTTRMACPPQIEKQQTAILVALEETATAISDGKDKVMLLSSDGRILMTLVRAQKAE